MAMVAKVFSALAFLALACSPLVPWIFSLAIHTIQSAQDESDGKEELILEATENSSTGLLQATMDSSVGLPPGQGGCAQYDFDNYQAPDANKCYLRMYECHHQSGSMSPSNHNVGDITWALSRGCPMYGGYLHIYNIEVARTMLDGVRGLYRQCNFGTCGCSPSLAQCERARAAGKVDYNAFGWRTKGASYQFSLPSRARGEVDNTRAAAFVANHGYKDKGLDAPFQWQMTKYVRTVPIKPCFDKYIRGLPTEEAQIAAFEKHVLSNPPSPECQSGGHFTSTENFTSMETM